MPHEWPTTTACGVDALARPGSSSCSGPIVPWSVWVVIGAPVALWARAAARSTVSSYGVIRSGAGRHLDDARPDAGLVDAVGELAHEELGHLAERVAPVLRGT